MISLEAFSSIATLVLVIAFIKLAVILAVTAMLPELMEECCC